MHLPDRFEVSIEGLEAGSQVTAGRRARCRRAPSWPPTRSCVLAIVTPAPTAEQLEGDTGEAAEAAEATRPPRARPPRPRPPPRPA